MRERIWDRKMTTKACEYCGAPYEPSRPWQRFDREECRRKSHEDRYRRGEAAEALIRKIDDLIKEWKKATSKRPSK